MPNERSLLGVIPETGEYQTGDALLRSVLDAQGHNRLLLSFSCGKDSLAMWLWLRETKQVEIIPYFLYWVPGLSFVERALDYYEQVFGQRITRLPHPLFYDLLTTWRISFRNGSTSSTICTCPGSTSQTSTRSWRRSTTWAMTGTAPSASGQRMASTGAT